MTPRVEILLPYDDVAARNHWNTDCGPILLRGNRTDFVQAPFVHRNEAFVSYRHWEERHFLLDIVEQYDWMNTVETLHWRHQQVQKLAEVRKQLEKQGCLPNIRAAVHHKNGIDYVDVVGPWIRAFYDPLFFGGGHHFVSETYAEYIPENEIWLEYDLPDKLAFEGHETDERKSMRHRINYDRAHFIATGKEMVFRNGLWPGDTDNGRGLGEIRQLLLNVPTRINPEIRR